MLDEYSLRHTKEPIGEPEGFIPTAIRVNSLAELDIEAELLNLYQDTRDFLEKASNDKEVAANQVAQIIGQLKGVLQDIVKMQTSIHDAERVKKLEFCILEAMKEIDTSAQDRFFLNYEKLLGIE